MEEMSDACQTLQTGAAGRIEYQDADSRSARATSPNRYIHTNDAETHPPIAEIVEELNVIEAGARETDRSLREILKQLGVTS